MNKYVLIGLFLVSCGKGSSGAPGIDGLPGNPGSDGEPCTVVENNNSVTVSCPDGTSATFNNCFAEEVENGVLLTCGDESTLISKSIHDYGKHKGPKDD